MSLARLTGVDNNNKLTARKTTTTTIRHYAVIAKLVEDCYEEEDIDKKSPNSVQTKFSNS
jgi:hypothetical protein